MDTLPAVLACHTSHRPMAQHSEALPTFETLVWPATSSCHMTPKYMMHKKSKSNTANTRHIHACRLKLNFYNAILLQILRHKHTYKFRRMTIPHVTPSARTGPTRPTTKYLKHQNENLKGNQNRQWIGAETVGETYDPASTRHPAKHAHAHTSTQEVRI